MQRTRRQSLRSFLLAAELDIVRPHRPFMKHLPISPHVGLGPVLLGASRSVVRASLASLGFPLEQSRGALDYFCEAAIQVEVGADNSAEFIGVSCHPAFQATYFGVDVFDISASELFALVAAREGTGSHTYNPMEYLFTAQIIALWEADEQYDCRAGARRVVWGQVGIGNGSYLAASQQIAASRPAERGA